MLTEDGAPGPFDVDPAEAENKEQLLGELKTRLSELRKYSDNPNLLMPSQPMPSELEEYTVNFEVPEDDRFPGQYTLKRLSPSGYSTGSIGVPKELLGRHDDSIEGDISLQFGNDGTFERVFYMVRYKNQHGKDQRGLQTVLPGEREGDYKKIKQADLPALRERFEHLVQRGIKPEEVSRIGLKEETGSISKFLSFPNGNEFDDIVGGQQYRVHLENTRHPGTVMKHIGGNRWEEVGKIELPAPAESIQHEPDRMLTTEELNALLAMIGTELGAPPIDAEVIAQTAVPDPTAEPEKPTPETPTPERLSEEKLAQLKEALPLLLELGLRHDWDEGYEGLAKDERLAKLLDAETLADIRTDWASAKLSTEKIEVRSTSWPSGAVEGRVGEVLFYLDRLGFRTASDYDKLRSAPPEPLGGSPEDFDEMYEEIKQRVGDELEERVQARQQRIEVLKQKLGNPEHTGGGNG
ncbi:MAG: hypothetical protein WAP74_02770 [Patescibacteria group bacterium]